MDISLERDAIVKDSGEEEEEETGHSCQAL